MKKLLIVALLSLFASSCSEDSFVLKGEISGARQGEKISLVYPILKDGVWYERELEAAVVDGTFIFEGEINAMTNASLLFENMDEVDLFIEPRRMTISMERERPYAYDMRGVSVWPQQKGYREFLGDMPRMIYEKTRVVQTLNEEWMKAYETKSESADSLMQEFYSVVRDYKTLAAKELDLKLEFIVSHPENAISPYLLYEVAGAQHADVSTIHSAYESLSEQNKNSLLGQMAKRKIDIISVDTGGAVGDKSYDFNRCGVDGKSVQMADVLDDGEYLLLDFWASWCQPCLQQIPDVQRAYEKYHPKGLNIIGVSSDEDDQAWRAAIEKYNLSSYPQVLSVSPTAGDDRLLFEEFENIADRYEVDAIPCFILIDSTGEIVARWQHFSEEIISYLDTLFAK